MSTAVIDQFATDNEDAVNVHGIDQSSSTCLGKDLLTAYTTEEVGVLVHTVQSVKIIL